MGFLRCFSTLGCPQASLDEVFALARAHQVGAVELRALGGTIDLPAQLARECGTPAEFARRVAASGVRVVALDTSLRLADYKPGDLEAFLAYLPWAEALGGVRLRVFDGGHASDVATYRAMADKVAWWRDLREKNHWRSDLMVETHDSLFTAAAIGDFLRLAPGTAILWDTHHTWKKGGEDPVATWRSIRTHTVHLHFKDSISRPTAKHPFTYVLPGEGEFPYGPLRAEIVGHYDGPLSLEWERMWHPYLPPLEDALRAATSRGWW